ncbi:gliding motility-associated C-terminal domain-containing protein [Chitinophagaceae bacterium MMS25-I14]
MRKCLLFVALLIVSQLNILKAQSLFSAPDTVCVRQPVHLTGNVSSASTYYWGFCSGYLQNAPVLTNIGSGFSFNGVDGAIEIAKDNGNYYGFVANATSNELLRLDFGASMANVPTVTSLGNLNNTLPTATSSLSLVKDAIGEWHLFAVGGTTTADASFARFDFRTSLTNTPNSVNFGNPNSLLEQPKGMFVGFDGFNWYGFTVDKSKNDLVRFNFGNNPSLTPIVTSYGNVGGLSSPNDIAAVQDAGDWYFLVVNEGDNTMSRITFGNTLSNTPAGINLGNINGEFFDPSAVTIIKDCGNYYAFVTDRLSNEITKVTIPSLAGTYSAVLLGTGSGVFSSPSGLSGMLRDKDNLYAFAVNGDNSLSSIVFAQCTNSSIASSDSSTPPVYTYNTPGIYNVYLAVDEGKPTMQVDCKQIYVEAIPKINISNDTVLCQGDTISLFIQSGRAISYVWRPYYNISDTVGMKVKVWPEYTLPYYITLTYPDGCIVDTPIHVSVSKVKADAGSDRTLADGATTLLGGPLTSTNGHYVYNWTPSIFLNNTTITNPTATPAYDVTYYLEVTELNDNLGCKDIDTVVIHTACTELTLPNAFIPESKSGGANRFGLLNKQIVKLNYFRIFDRWGKEVFSTTDPTKEWDGKINGDPAPFGVYVWEVDGFCVSGLRLNKVGNVTLIR